MSDYITDPELLKQLNPSATNSGYVNDPELLKQLNAETIVGPQPDMALPTGYMTTPTGAGQLITDLNQAGVFDPITQSFKSRAGEYLTKPGKAIIDAATMYATGLPTPPMALYDTYKAAQESIPKAMQALNSMPDVNPETVRTFVDKLKPQEIDQLQQLVKSSGGKGGITSFELPARLANDAEAVAAFNALKTEAAAAPGMLSRLGMPVVRGLAKVAGPAATAYDIYEAGKYAQESELGKRLAQGEGQFAPNASRNLMTNQNVSGYRPSGQEAANLLASGDQRMIQMYGGVKQLASMASQTQAQPQPVNTSWIDNAMNLARKYRIQPGR
jgi:hypothetical protein